MPGSRICYIPLLLGSNPHSQNLLYPAHHGVHLLFPSIPPPTQSFMYHLHHHVHRYSACFLLPLLPQYVCPVYCQDLDEDLLSLLSDPLPMSQQGVSQMKPYSLTSQQSVGMDPTQYVSHLPEESGRRSCVGSQTSGVMDLPPPTVLPLMESEGGSCIGSQHSGVMELPPPTQASTSQYCGVMDAPQGIISLQPANEILVENKGMWNEECVTRLANKLARFCYFSDDVLLQSTLTGKKGDALDERRLQALLDDIKVHARQ